MLLSFLRRLCVGGSGSVDKALSILSSFFNFVDTGLNLRNESRNKLTYPSVYFLGNFLIKSYEMHICLIDLFFRLIGVFFCYLGLSCNAYLSLLGDFFQVINKVAGLFISKEN